MSHQSHFPIISITMICLFLQRPSIWPPWLQDFKLSWQADAFPPASLSLPPFHSLCLGFTFHIKKKCHRRLARALIFLTFPHYNTWNICSSAAEHQIVCEECSAHLNWHFAQQTCPSQWKELNGFVVFVCNIFFHTSKFMEMYFIREAQPLSIHLPPDSLIIALINLHCWHRGCTFQVYSWIKQGVGTGKLHQSYSTNPRATHNVAWIKGGFSASFIHRKDVRSL